MGLKLFTGLMLLATLALLVFRNQIVGPVPQRSAKRAVTLAYAERDLAFTGLLIVTLTCAGIGSIVLVRRANAEYRRLALENMQELIEGTIRDQQSKVAPSDSGEHSA